MKESMLQLNQKIDIYHNELESYMRENSELKQENFRLRASPDHTSCPMCPVHLARIGDLEEEIARYKAATLSKVRAQEGDLLREKSTNSRFSLSLQRYLDELAEIRGILSDKEVREYIEGI